MRFGRYSWPSTTNDACEATSTKPVRIRIRDRERAAAPPPRVSATSTATMTTVRPVDHSSTGLRPTRSAIGPPAIVPARAGEQERGVGQAADRRRPVQHFDDVERDERDQPEVRHRAHDHERAELPERTSSRRSRPRRASWRATGTNVLSRGSSISATTATSATGNDRRDRAAPAPTPRSRPSRTPGRSRSPGCRRR